MVIIREVFTKKSGGRKELISSDCLDVTLYTKHEQIAIYSI